MAPTEKSFSKLDGTPVYYTDGTTTARTWYCTQAFYDQLVTWMRTLRALSHTYGNSTYNTVSYLRSQGLYVNKTGAHGQGRAMDLAYVKWNGVTSAPMNGDHKSSTLSVRRRYYAVEAVTRMRFRYVLDGYYNSAHGDHLHYDDSALPTVCLKNSRSDVLFVQGVCNNHLGTSLALDGVWGSGTSSAFSTALSRLKVTGDPHTSATAWKTFCERAAAHGFRNASFGFYDWYKPGGYYSWASENFPSSYMRHRSSLGYLSAPATATDKADATWKIRTGLTGQGISLESKNFPGSYLRHANGRLRLSTATTDSLFKQDATFYPRNGLARDGASWRSLEASNFPGSYIRHRNSELWLDRFDGTDLFRRDATWSFKSPLA